MKKILAVLLFVASPVFAARAAVIQIDFPKGATELPKPKVVVWPVKVTYQGGDVPNEPQNVSLDVAVSSSTLPAQISAAIVAAVQTEATNRGFTVPAGNTLMPSFTLQ